MAEREPYNPYKHGISYTKLSNFLECRQKARFDADGVTSKMPSYPLTFGTVCHEVLKSAHDGISAGDITKIPGPKRVAKWVVKAEEAWRKNNPRATKKALEHLDLAAAIAEVVMPEYFKYWSKSLFHYKWDKKYTEKFHKIPFRVTGQITIDINVVMDSVYWDRRIRKRDGKRFKSMWLFETKTSSRIDSDTLIDTIPIGLQHGIYTLAIERLYGKLPRGVLYNFIRRPGIYRRKDEGTRDYAARCLEDIQKRPEWYFLRLKMDTDRDEVEKVRAELQGLILEYLRWYDKKMIHYRTTGACVNKFGRCTFLDICSRDDYTFFSGGPSVQPK